MVTPTLVTHGARDYRVPDCNGLAYFHTLKARGVDARLLWFPDENHWVLKPANSRQWHQEFHAWLARHGAEGPKAGAARNASRRTGDALAARNAFRPQALGGLARKA
jgi:acetyl esterase/lipase